MDNCQNIKQINIGTLPDKVFPADDGKTYIYKRSNGHIYIYSLQHEKHVCCDDGTIESIPIRTNTDFTHFPDVGHVFIYIMNNILYSYNSEGVITNLSNSTESSLNWTLNQW